MSGRLYSGNTADQQHKRRGAMYVRMSTDHQKYSTENQADAIREYAAARNIEIVEVYTDSGKSGLKIDGREALQKLISDVQSGCATYNVILVLDVTRWGRFQDADESAYYEYLCRRSGIDVQYVAEQFENDGSPVSTIVKGVKRAMAGEYSRELSGKVFAGQCRLIELGFKQGGSAGYGLRRVLVDEHGQQKAVLKRGEHKSLQTDRVVLKAGPKEEVEIVRWIFKSYTEDGLTETQIAALLNQRNIKTDLDRLWSRSVVHGILTNEKYIGNNVFNKRSFKLKKRRVINSPEMWVRSDGAFQAIVEPKYFYAAQGIIRERNRKYTNEDLLSKLRNLHDKQGWLSGVLIDETDDMPSSSVYVHRFGGLTQAYKLIGYDPGRDLRYIEENKRLRRMYPEIIENVIKKIQEYGGTVCRDLQTDFLIINNEIKISLVICRCSKNSAGHCRWKMQFDTSFMPDITIVVRMEQDNQNILDYYLMPAIDIENPDLRLRENNSFALDAYKFESLDIFYPMTERVLISEVA